MSQHDSSLTQDTIGALVRVHRVARGLTQQGAEGPGGQAGKECLISGSRAGKVLPIGYMWA